jgi:hypothetical protein
MRYAMKKTLIVGFMLTAIATAATADHVIDEGENPRFLFVMSAQSGSFDGETLTLHGVPSVVYFSDRPYRIAGHLSLQEFAELWGEGTDNFAGDPPNATLSILGEDGDGNNVIVLKNLLLVENRVAFEITILKGEVPASFEASSLFIDPNNNGDPYGERF